MKISGICFTKAGKALSRKVMQAVRDYYSGQDLELDWYSRGKYTDSDGDEEIKPLDIPLSEWAHQGFEKCDTLIFIGASGIAVRTIAPYVKDKRTDPAVVVIDERGNYCISLLSGHIGGANAFVSSLAPEIGALPVITTATDVNHKFAVDVYAKENDLVISNMTYAKEVSAALVAGEPVGFYTNFPVDGELPEGIYWPDKLTAARNELGAKDREGISVGVYISPSYNRAYFDHTLWLIPRCIVIGIGCKRNTPASAIAQLVDDTLRQYSLYPEAVAAVASIDLKADEPGLLEFCRSRELPFYTFSAEALKSLEGDFTPSPFVEGKTGVDNVCERSAVMQSGGELIIPKTIGNGVTVAMAMTDWRVKF